ncbi:hypothetical protein [Streptomyces sp. 7N604]|uniref:hypothetical protein n=1 Tax=Streptomyces sp. 7N604 TaxID=3457415 RepID=UPI003FD4617C
MRPPSVLCSLGGEADFHASAPAGRKLYAFDSQTGQLHVSQNKGATWKRTGTFSEVPGAPVLTWSGHFTTIPGTAEAGR